MALQFIFGGSGRGKTFYLQHHIVDEALKHPDKEYIIIVPEQFTMQTQKELVSLSPGKGIINIEVQSFLRLAFRIFSELGAGREPVLDDMGKTMILKKVLSDRQQDFEYFGRNIHKKGYITQIKSFLSELIQYGVSDETLMKMIDRADKKPVLKRKLMDMSVAYKAFLEYINNNYITSEEVITVLTDIVGNSKILKDSVICLDGFTGFTPLQYELLSELMKTVSMIYISIAADKREPVTHIGEKHKLFFMSRKTVCRLRDIAYENGVEIYDDKWVDTDSDRFLYAPALSALERNIFRYPSVKYTKEVNDISIHVLKQPENEAAFIVQEINHLLRNGDCRFRDIAVIAGDLSVYGTLVDSVFKQAALPYFIDQKKSVLDNPFVVAIDALLNIFIKDFAYEDVMRFLKGSFADITEEQADIADNFLLASGIRGHKKWADEWDCKYVYRRKKKTSVTYAKEQINSVRKYLSELLLPIYKDLVSGKHTVRHFSEIICKFIDEQNYYKILIKESEKFLSMGEPSLSGEYEQIYGIVMSVFDRLVELLGDEKMKIDEFKELLDVGFSEARIGLIPPKTDQIVVGDMSRTRIADIKYLFFIGVNDINIPKGGGSGGILSESERSFLTEEKFELAPDTRQMVYQEQFYLYLNMTKPSRHLYITYCETGNDGKARNRSYIVERICRIFPKLSISVEDMRKDDEHILADDLGIKYLIQGLRNSDFNDSKWQELYSFYFKNESYKKMLDRITYASFYREQKSQISREAAKALYGDILRVSTSQLERYAACAFSYFVQYGLKLEERAEHKVEFFDIGNIVHEALELYTAKLLKSGRQWGELSEEEQHIQANECLNETVEKYKNGLMYDTERDTYMVSRLRKLLLRTVWAITKQMELGRFETVKSEFSFDVLEGSKYKDEGEKEDDMMHLIGRIDRVDTCKDGDNIFVKIIDYKTGRKDMSLSDVYHGLQMQLVIYLNAGIETESEVSKIVIPAGMLYYNIFDPVIEGKTDKEEAEKEILKSLMMRGIVNEDDPILPYIDANFMTDTGQLPPKLSSIVAPFATDKDGNLKKQSQAITTDDFDKLISYTRKNIIRMSNEIMSGNTLVNPYKKNDSSKKTACEYCVYHDICRFDARIQDSGYRILNKISDDDVMRLIGEDDNGAE